MPGWIADFFRFWWALAYWNIRKTWFRLTGAHRDSCPCQYYGDSGLAMDSRCAAAASWNSPRRFRKVCPLLVEAAGGWRCGVDAERVRPFWGRAFFYGGSILLALYLIGSAALFMRLRNDGQAPSYLTVVLPWRWVELRNTREHAQAESAEQAVARGDYPAAIRALQTVCELNPHNLDAGLSLASLLQSAGQPDQAEQVYERLIRDIPEQRPAIAQPWFQLLLARADYAHLKPLATAMLSEDSRRRELWLQALLFAARQTADEQVLGTLLRGEHGLPEWCAEAVAIEQLLIQKRTDRALPRLNRRAPASAAGYLTSYQAGRLLRLDRPADAAAVLAGSGNRLPADEASLLRLRTLEARAWTAEADAEADALLRQPLSPRLAALSCAFLLEHPASPFLSRYLERFLQAGPAAGSETLPLYHAAYLAAALAGDSGHAQKILAVINGAPRADSQPLQRLAALLQQHAPAGQIAGLLPLVPLPLEVIYVIHEDAPASAP